MYVMVAVCITLLLTLFASTRKGVTVSSAAQAVHTWQSAPCVLAADSVLQRHGTWEPAAQAQIFAHHHAGQLLELQASPCSCGGVVCFVPEAWCCPAWVGLGCFSHTCPLGKTRACQAAAGGAPSVSLLQAACPRVQSRFGARQGCRSTGLARDRVSRRPHLLGPRALPRRPWRTGSRTGSNERRSQVRPSVLLVGITGKGSPSEGPHSSKGALADFASDAAAVCMRPCRVPACHGLQSTRPACPACSTTSMLHAVA